MTVEVTTETTTPRARLLRFFIGPLFGYAVCYLILTFPLVDSFSSSFWCNSNDGYQMVWNLWCVRYTLFHLHQFSWHTSLVKYPDGITLLLHSLTTLNGLISIPLAWMGEVRTYNTIIIFSFAASGLTAFWLAYDQTRAYLPSLVGGYAFTFSAIHFAHASGHLNQISNEFVPLFLLLWLRLLNRPGIFRALIAAICLLLVMLGDQYLFSFCVIAGAVAAVRKITRQDALQAWRTRRALVAGFLFVGFVLSTCGVLVFTTWRAAGREPLIGLHNPNFYSPSVIGLIVPGWQWQWHALLDGIWSKLGQYEETTTSIGVATFIFAIIGIVSRKRMHFSSAGLWVSIATIFTLFALGPTWRLWYETLTTHTPYRLLMWLVPSMRYSGCAGRMMIMAQLAICILAAAGANALTQLTRSRRLLIGGALLLAMAIESQPRLLDTSSPDVPKWVDFIRDFPGDGAIIDTITFGSGQGMYFQTIHHHPMAGGYIARTPASIENHAIELFGAVRNGDVAALTPFQLIVVPTSRAILPLPVVYKDRFAVVYENTRYDHEAAALK